MRADGGKAKLHCHLLLPLGLQVRYLLLPQVSRAGVHFQHAPLHVRVLYLDHTLQLVRRPVQCRLLSHKQLPHQGLLYIWQSSTHTLAILHHNQQAQWQRSFSMQSTGNGQTPAPQPTAYVHTMQVCYSNCGCKAIADFVANTLELIADAG